MIVFFNYNEFQKRKINLNMKLLLFKLCAKKMQIKKRECKLNYNPFVYSEPY